MEWRLSEEQSTYQETLRGWLADIAPSDTLRRWLDQGDLGTFHDRFVSDGWWGVGVEEARGGQGGGVVELALTAEELGRTAVPSSAWLASMIALPALGSLPSHPVAWLSPAEAPPNAASIAVSDDGRLTGTVPRVLAGAEAAAFVLAVDAGRGLELRRIDANDEGVARSSRALLDRTRGVADITLTGTPSTRLEVKAQAALTEATDLAAVLVAADALGASERMLELAVDYSKQRRQFGVPIGSFQAVKHAAATIEVGVEAARSAVYFAAASLEATLDDASLHAAAVKAQVTAEASNAADTALTMHGAIGYTWEHDLHLFYKRARLDAYLFGDAALWNERLADRLALV